jgi:hypothetical protein
MAAGLAEDADGAMLRLVTFQIAFSPKSLASVV